MRLYPVLLLGVLPALVSAGVYKLVGPDGQVTYTDQEPSRDQTYEKVKVPVPNGGRLTTPAQPQPADASPPAEEKLAALYRTFSIAVPAPNSELRENAGNVTVSLQLEPDLTRNAGHRIVLLMDGKLVAEGASLSFQLSNVDRGTHQLQAEIRAASGERIMVASPVTFTLHRISILAPNRRPASP